MAANRVRVPLLFPIQIEREREITRGNGDVRERVVLRSRRDSRRRRGAARCLPGEARLRPGSPRFIEVLSHHSRQAQSHLRGRLASVLRWRAPPLLVHQNVPRLSRFLIDSVSFFFSG